MLAADCRRYNLRGMPQFLTAHQPNRRAALSLAVLVVAWGLQAIVTQSLLIREALVLMYGSEFAWGIVLFAWLFGVAVGAGIGGRAASHLRCPDAALTVALLLLSAAACAELWIFRGARTWFGIGIGELLPLSQIALAALILVSPVSALVGLAFPLACRVIEARRPPDHAAGPLADVYALESFGSLLGGAAFSFWAVEHLTPIQTALACAAITSIACAALLATTGHRRLPSAILLMLTAALSLTAVFLGGNLNAMLVQRRWESVAPGSELLAEAESRYQNLALGRRAGQYTLYCDGQVSADFPDPYTYVPLAHFWMCQHPDPRRVLILGGGAEGLLAEVLRHPVERVDYLEPDPRQIELLVSFLPDTDRQALADPRISVHHLDARRFLKTQRNRYDLVIARLPDPISALRARFYTDEFYRELRQAMTDRSVLALAAAATPGDLTPAAADYLASIRATIRRHIPHITVGWGDPAQVLAATAEDLVSTDARVLAARYERRAVEAPMFDPLWFNGGADWLDPAKVRARTAQLDAAAQVAISTDLRPAVYVQRLALWERMTGGPSQRWIERLRGVSLTGLIALLTGVGGVVLIAYRIRARDRAPAARSSRCPSGRFGTAWFYGATVLSVATTGFATMALSIIWLFAFQNLYGYVYQRIGWIIALFMGGLVIGCWLVGVLARRASRRVRTTDPPLYLPRRLIAADLLLALLSLSAPFVLPALGRMQTTPAAFLCVEWTISLLVAGSGLLGGAAFALAGGLQLAATGRAGAAAGNVVGADHAGACLGALFTGVLLVPIFGTAATALLLVGMKIISAALLAWTGFGVGPGASRH